MVRTWVELVPKSSGYTNTFFPWEPQGDRQQLLQTYFPTNYQPVHQNPSQVLTPVKLLLQLLMHLLVQGRQGLSHGDQITVGLAEFWTRGGNTLQISRVDTPKPATCRNRAHGRGSSPPSLSPTSSRNRSPVGPQPQGYPCQLLPLLSHPPTKPLPSPRVWLPLMLSV